MDDKMNQEPVEAVELPPGKVTYVFFDDYEIIRPPQDVRAEALLSRREAYASAVPHGVDLLTAGVDTQNNRLECEIVGWGRDEESWSIDYRIFPGDPSLPEVWQELDDYLQKPWAREDGRTLSVQAASVDTQGHHAQAASAFCRKNSGRRVWAIRGQSEQIGKRLHVWPSRPSLYKASGPFYVIGTQAAKDIIYRRLEIEEPGPGYSHFPTTYGLYYFKQLTAEIQVSKTFGGQRFFVWGNPQSLRNEALDCRVYAYAALCGLKSMGLQPFMGSGSTDKAPRAKGWFARMKSTCRHLTHILHAS